MIVCPKCNNKISLLSRSKSINSSVIECDKCKQKYKMKYYQIYVFINVVLVFLLSPRLDSLFPETSFLVSMIRNLAIVLICVYIIYFVLSYFIKYEDYEETKE